MVVSMAADSSAKSGYSVSAAARMTMAEAAENEALASMVRRAVTASLLLTVRSEHARGTASPQLPPR
jgi:hypothetical protein